MRLFSRYNLMVLLVAAPLVGEVTLWIRSYFANDYLFCRWMKVTDENGHQVDFASRTRQQWQQHPGSKFQTRYLAVASRGGGVCLGLVLARYVETEDADSTLLLLLLQHNRDRVHDGRSIGTGHSSSVEYPLTEENPKYGFAYQKRLYTDPAQKATVYREHWAVVVPHWFLFTLVSLPCLLYLRQLIRRLRWQIRGCCPKCGYDLRNTPGNCPECGPPEPAKPQ